MKIALISDIHANLPALEAVMKHIQDQNILQMFNAGDLVGYGAYPDEVIKFIQSSKAQSIIGNYDSKVLRFPQKASLWAKKKKPEKYFAFEWAYHQLSQTSLVYLHSLPKRMRLSIKEHRVLITHGSPASAQEFIGPSTSEARLGELSILAKADVVISGHSHIPFNCQVGGTWFVNPGSVGRPDDGDPRASYAVLAIKPSSLKVYYHRIEYDIDRAVSAVRRAGLPEAFAQMLILGRNFDDVMKRE